MRKIFIILILTLGIGHLNASTGFKEKPHNVLLIYSYSPDFPTFTQVMEGFNKRFAEEDIHMKTELLFSKAEQSEAYFKKYKKIFSHRIRGKKYDLVIACDDNALNFVQQNKMQYFQNIPVIFMGINDIEKAYSLDTAHMYTGIAETVSIKKSIALAKKLNPELKELIAISDNTKTGTSDLAHFLKLKYLPGIKKSYLNFSRYSLKDFADTLSRINGNKAFLLLSAYHSKDSVTHTFTKSLNKIIEASQVPVYHLWHHGFGKGITGGRFVSHLKMAENAAEMAVRVLDGHAPNEIPVMDAPHDTFLDYKKVQQFQLNADAIKAKWNIINKPPEGFNIRQEYFYAMLLFLLILAFTIALLLMNNFKQKRIKSLLQEKHYYYKSLFEKNYISMMLLHPKDGKVIQANQAACNFHGYSHQEMERMYLHDLNMNNPEVNKRLMNKAREVKQNVFASRHMLKNNEIREVNVYLQNLMIDDNHFLYAAVIDVTKQRAYERALIAAKKQAEESDQLKSAFLNNLSHEVRTPLNSIVGFANLITEHELPKEQKNKYAAHIYRASDDLTTTISNMIDIALLQSGQLLLEPAEVSVNKLLNTIYEAYLQKHEASGLLDKLEFEVDTLNKDVLLYIDKQRIIQVINNLIDNAIKFTKKGKISFGASHQQEAYILFFVKDTGIGIPPEKHNIIFQPFRQEQLEISHFPGGTGLGLSIAGQLVELHNGSLWLESDKYAGAVFYFQIPFNPSTRNL